MTVHGAIYVLDPYAGHTIATAMDNLVHRGEIVSLWDKHPDETYENWGCPWHIANPTVLRFVIEDVALSQVDWIKAEWRAPDNNGIDTLIAKRVWRFDIDAILAEESARLGRPVDPQTDVIVVDRERLLRWVKRRAEDGSGMMFNKAAGDIPLFDPNRLSQTA